MQAANIPLITTLATGLGLALALGFVATLLRLPAIVGYLMAGVLVGPYTPGFVANSEITYELSEIAVMLLMFGVGLHLSLKDLLEVKNIAVPGAILQIIVATLLGLSMALGWGWSVGGALVFGIALSVASTVVLLRALEERGLLASVNGKIAVGWLIVEDLAMVLVLVILPPLGEWLTSNVNGDLFLLLEKLGLTVLKVTAFIAIMLIIGRKVFPRILWWIARTGTRELFTLCVVTAAITIAYIAAKLFGVSFALGAFFAGLTLGESPLSHRAAEESLPLREAFAVLFFISVGMLFDPNIILTHYIQIIMVVAIIIFGKTLAAAFLVLCFRYPLNTALTVSASLAQIGEFSFILTNMGVNLKLLPVAGQNLIVAGALVSISLNPLLFSMINPLQTWIKKHVRLKRHADKSIDPLTNLPKTTTKKVLADHVVLVGYGRVGKRIGEILALQEIPFVVVEENRSIVKRLRKLKIAAVVGDATNPSILNKTHIEKANILVIAIPNNLHVRNLIKTARALNPKIKLLVRTHTDEETVLLERENVEKIFYAEVELAESMTSYILNHYL